MGQTSVCEAREAVHAATSAAIATADQSVAAHSPRIAWTTTNMPGTLSAFRDTAESRRCVTELALLAFVATAHTQRSRFVSLCDRGMRVTLVNQEDRGQENEHVSELEGKHSDPPI